MLIINHIRWRTNQKSEMAVTKVGIKHCVGKCAGLENQLSEMACGFKSYRYRYNFCTLRIEYWRLKWYNYITYK